MFESPQEIKQGNCFSITTSLYLFSGIRTGGLEDAQNAVTWQQNVSAKKVPMPLGEGSALRRTSDKLDLGDTVGVTENDTNLRRGSTLSGELADLLNDLLGGGLQPAGSGAAVGEGRSGDTLSFAVKSTHVVGGCRLSSSVEDGVFEMEISWAGATKLERPNWTFALCGAMQIFA